MKVCPGCGRKYDSDAYAFCKACGTRLVDCDEPLEEDGNEGRHAATGSAAGTSTPSGGTAQDGARSAATAAASAGAKAAQTGAKVAAAAASAGSKVVSGAMDSLIAMAPQDLTITGDGKAVYAPGTVLMLDNLADFLFLVERPPFTWWMILLLVLAGFTFVVAATGWGKGDDYLTVSLLLVLLVVVAYLMRRALAKKTLVFSMSSGDKAKVVSRDEADLRKAFGVISKALVSREAFEYTFASAELDVTGK